MVAIRKDCYTCHGPIVLSKKGDKWIRFDLNHQLHICKQKTEATNTVEAKPEQMNEKEFVQRTVAKYEENRQKEEDKEAKIEELALKKIEALNNIADAIRLLAEVTKHVK